MIKYSRQLKFLSNYIDINKNLEEIQENFMNKKIVIIGCGGVGSILSELLVRSGFLNLVIVDIDLVEETNLGRQNFFESDIGNVKSVALSKYLKLIDKNVKVKVFRKLLDDKNIDEICKNCDLIIDATDNFNTRKIINFYCEKNNLNWIYNGAIKSEIVCCLFKGQDKLFNKVFENKIIDQKCCDVGVLAATTYTSASICLVQILKYFLGLSEYKLIKFDIWKNKFHEIKIK